MNRLNHYFAFLHFLWLLRTHKYKSKICFFRRKRFQIVLLNCIYFLIVDFIMADADDETGRTPQPDPKDGDSNLPRDTLVSNSEIV